MLKERSGSNLQFSRELLDAVVFCRRSKWEDGVGSYRCDECLLLGQVNQQTEEMLIRETRRHRDLFSCL